jgi:uncharacterized protein (DUF58 family)
MDQQQSPGFYSILSMRLTRIISLMILWYALMQQHLALILLTAGILFISYMSLLWTKYAHKHLSVEVIPENRRLYPSQGCRVTLTLKNEKFLPVWCELEISLNEHVLMSGSSRLKTFVFSHEQQHLERVITPEKRGVYALGSTGLKAGDPFGLLSRRKLIPLAGELIVYPRKRAARFPSLQFQEFFGLSVTKELVEDPCWYEGTRDYTGTKPARNINWKASARLGSLQEKVFESTSHRKILLVLDVREYREHGSEDKFELMIEAAAALARRLSENGSSFAAVINGALIGDFPPNLPLERGPEHLGVLLEMLARSTSRPLRELIPLTSRPEFRGAGIAYFGYRVPEISEIAPDVRAPLLYICTYLDEPGDPYYTSGEVLT